MPSLFCRSVLLLLFLPFLTACSEDKTEPLRFYAFGTIIEVTLPGLDADRKTDIEQQLVERFQHWQTYWHPWQNAGKDTGHAAVNRALAGDGHGIIDAELHDLMTAARLQYRDSDGLFDPALGGLVKLWGFNQEEMPSGPPAADTLNRWLHNPPRYSDLEIHEASVSTDQHGLQLDFGGFAKGYALDRAAELLRREGIDNALINTGGDLIALGNAGNRPWRIGIRHPRQSGVLASAELAAGETLVTSGDYERYFIAGNKRYHHILDPRTARPAEGTIAVSVIDRHGARADAAATALFVAGPEDWRQTAAAMNIDCAMLIDTGGDIHMTECMQQRLEFRIDPAGGIEVTP